MADSAGIPGNTFSAVVAVGSFAADLSFSREEKLGDLGRVNFRVRNACLTGGIPVAGLLRVVERGGIAERGGIVERGGTAERGGIVERGGTDAADFLRTVELEGITGIAFLLLVGGMEAPRFFRMTGAVVTGFFEESNVSLFDISDLWV